jgi:hypothetical protein
MKGDLEKKGPDRSGQLEGACALQCPRRSFGGVKSRAKAGEIGVKESGHPLPKPS